MLTLRVFTPEKLTLEADSVESVILPAFEGEMGILPRHAPAIVQLSPGVLRVHRGGGETELFAVSGGFAEVRDNVVSVFAETAEMQSEIDAERARQDLERAKADLAAQRGHDVTLGEAEAAIARAAVRLKVSQMVKRKKSA